MQGFLGDGGVRVGVGVGFGVGERLGDGLGVALAGVGDFVVRDVGRHGFPPRILRCTRALTSDLGVTTVFV